MPSIAYRNVTAFQTAVRTCSVRITGLIAVCAGKHNFFHVLAGIVWNWFTVKNILGEPLQEEARSVAHPSHDALVNIHTSHVNSILLFNEGGEEAILALSRCVKLLWDDQGVTFAFHLWIINAEIEGRRCLHQVENLLVQEESILICGCQDCCACKGGQG